MKTKDVERLAKTTVNREAAFNALMDVLVEITVNEIIAEEAAKQAAAAAATADKPDALSKPQAQRLPSRRRASGS